MSNLISNVPTHLLLGFLGVGKTSVILDCFRQKPVGQRWAVVVNEFGKLGIDGKIYQSQGIAVKEVPGGCLCCTVGLPFQVAVLQILKSQHPDRLFIESSGASHAAGVIKTLQQDAFNPVIDLKPYICIMDPRHLLDDRYLENANYQAQLAFADIVIANKIDLASDSALVAFDRFMENCHPAKSRIVKTSGGKIALDLLEGSTTEKSQPPNVLLHLTGITTNPYHTLDWQFPSANIFSHQKISQWLQHESFVRAKAVVNTDLGWMIFNVVDGSLNQLAITEATDTSLEVIMAEQHDDLHQYLNDALKDCMILETD